MGQTMTVMDSLMKTTRSEHTLYRGYRRMPTAWLSICAADGSSLICSVAAANGTLESCDGTDNDCDGSIR